MNKGLATFLGVWSQRHIRILANKIDPEPRPHGIGGTMGVGIDFVIPRTNENEEILKSDSMREIEGYRRVDWREWSYDDNAPKFDIPVFYITYLKTI